MIILKMKTLYPIITLLFLAFATSNFVFAENPFNADIVVANDGSGDFALIQAALDAVPSNSERRTVIYIKRGLYNQEKLFIAGDKINITLIGESREETILSYHIYDCASGKCPTDDALLWTGDNIRTSATLTIHGDGFRAENLTIQNTAGPVGQAQAITVRSDKCVFVNCDLKGYQDTIYFWNEGKRSYFEGCLVVGRTDYIYGGGIVFFQDCEIRTWGGGYITAPSTALTQPYGFIFNECNITYALNSPRAGDDGEMIRFGRPWHNYPKVAWLGCEITEKLNPLGWGDIWDMEYAATSTDLHLYEYKNTGPGAIMTGRANWAGIKELTDEEALEYTVQKVMAGNNAWDPTTEDPLVQTYNWIGGGSTAGWLIAENWDPTGVPASNEAAVVNGKDTVLADGGTFAADLTLEDSATLEISSNSTATYISAANSNFIATSTVSLDGRIATKASIGFNISATLTLNSILSGVHDMTKTGEGKLILNADNINLSGDIIIDSGSVEAAVSNSLGKGSIYLKAGGILIIGDNNAFQPKSKLEAFTGAGLVLNGDVTLSEFFIDGVMQITGEYTSITNPSLISGSGSIIVGRPDLFTFIGGENGNWDNLAHFVPALLPLAGETVIVEKEMETTSTVFEADIILKAPGILRLRGDPSKNHTCTGVIQMEGGTSFKYNTGGTGMLLNAPIMVEGDVSMIMESGATEGSTMTLTGSISGSSTVSVINNGKGVLNNGTLLLTGDNSNFFGIWDLTNYSIKYPDTPGYVTSINGNSENAFGSGSIKASHNNRVIISHAKALGNVLNLTLEQSAKVTLSVNIALSELVINGNSIPDGVYSASTNPEFYEGTGTITVGSIVPQDQLPAFPGAEGHGKYTNGGRGGRVIEVNNLNDSGIGSLRAAIESSGARIVVFKVSGTIKLAANLVIRNDNITIAGQTAPGDGICIRDYPVIVDADNVIIRFMRFRMGDEAMQENDALGGRFHKNIIVDHCSMSWSTDECVSFYINENFTLQWSIISESLRVSVHDKGAHGYGGIWGGKNASFHHNLLASHDSRNPRLGEAKGDEYALTDLVDLRNNVIYNWGGNSCYGGEAMNANIVNCYYKPGPVTTKTERIISIDKLVEDGYAISNMWGKFYIDGNVLSASDRATTDNWAYGVYNQFNSKYGAVPQADKDAMRLSEPLNPGEVTTHTAELAYNKVLYHAGASLFRDPVDTRIIHDVSTGTATFMDGGNGSTKGIIDTQSAVGGWPVLNSTPALTDTDGDGMPDEWEIANSLNENSPDDAQLTTVDGLYPNLEVYLNSLVSDIIEIQNTNIPSGFRSAQVQDESPLKVFYNNSTEELMITHTDKIQKVQLYSIMGALIFEISSNENAVRFQTPLLKNGAYVVRILDDRNKFYAEKFIK